MTNRCDYEVNGEMVNLAFPYGESFWISVLEEVVFNFAEKKQDCFEVMCETDNEIVIKYNDIFINLEKKGPEQYDLYIQFYNETLEYKNYRFTKSMAINLLRAFLNM